MTRYLPYTLVLRSPLAMAAGLALPGSTLRAIVADRAADHRRHALCFGGQVRYLTANPATTEGLRALPVPLSWRADPDDELCDALADTPPPKARVLPGRWATLQQGAVLEVRPDRVVRRRHQRDPALGRPSLMAGALFETAAMAAGAVLGGLIAADGQDADRLLDEVQVLLAQRPLLLGGARRAGFGGLPTLEFGAVRDVEVPAGGRVLSSPPRSGDPLVLLLSPYVGRDPITGEVGAATLGAEVEEALGVPVGRIAGLDRALAGWNRRWRAAPAVEGAAEPGTVLELAAVPDPQRVAAAQHAGLGLRLVEGFGRFVLLASRVPRRLGMPSSVPPTPASIGEPDAMTRILERRLIQPVVRDYVLTTARAALSNARQPPSRSLLGRLRNGIEGDAGLATLRTWLSGSEGGLKRPALDQLRRSRVGTVSLKDWLDQQARPEAHKAAPAGSRTPLCAGRRRPD